jgi:hypothetical protein
MANKKITDLQLISSVTGTNSFPVDNGTQTYRATASQLSTYIFPNDSVVTAKILDANVTLPKLALNIFNGLTAVSAAEDDYLALVDTSDSNKTKKTLVSQFAKAGYGTAVATYAILTTDNTLKFSGASFTATFPTAVGVAGKRYKLVHAGTSLTQVYTLATTSSQTIGGIASAAYKLCTNGEVLEVESDGANWMIVNHYARVGLTTVNTITISAVTTPPTKGGTPSTDLIRWGRLGDIGKFRYEYKQSTGGSAGSGEYLWTLPTGISFDTNKCQFYTTATNGAGIWSTPTAWGSIAFSDSAGASQSVGMVVPYDATHFRVAVSYNNGTSPQRGFLGSGLFPMSSGAQSYTMDFDAPIADWQP